MRGYIDISDAAVVAPKDLKGPEGKAVDMFVEELGKRSGLRPEVAPRPLRGRAAIFVGSDLRLPGDVGKVLEKPSGEEGYRLWVDLRAGRPPRVFALGNGPRGTLYAVGRLLRELRIRGGRALVPEGLETSSSPRYPIRGHQLGYRPKTNSYDRWSFPQFEQYVRDLMVFGTNSIELIPPKSDDEPTSYHMSIPPMEMLVKMTEMLDSYGLDVWLWYAAIDGDYADPGVVKRGLEEREVIFRSCRRIDALFVPGGDPGEAHPRELMAFVSKVADLLHKYHPRATVWVSPQGYYEDRLDYFYAYLRTEKPDWLEGVVYGPWVYTTLPKLREAVPDRYRIRRYPDITHCVRCQYPVPRWDIAYAMTLGREPINPRPRDMVHIHNLLAPYADGSITYSEGCNDDVNKIVWGTLDWDPEYDLFEILREYGRYFIGDEFSEGVAQGLLSLEGNWRGRLLTN